MPWRAIRRRGGDVGVALAVEPVTALESRLQQAVLLQLARELRRDAGPLAELRQVDLVLLPAETLGGGERGRPGRSSSSRITRSGRNSSRCSRRMVTSRSTSASAKSRTPRASGSARTAPGPRDTGSSRSRCRGTRRAGARRPRRSCAGAAGRRFWLLVVIGGGTSAGTCRSGPRRRPRAPRPRSCAVDERAVEAAEVADREAGPRRAGARHDAARRSRRRGRCRSRATARSACAPGRLERLPRAASAGAHDERRPAMSTGSASGAPRVRGSSSSRRRRRHESRAAARAVGRCLGALEAALRAVDVTHPPSGGVAALPWGTLGEASGSHSPPRRASLGAEDVDVAVHDPPMKRDVVLLLLELPDHHPQLVVGASRGRGAARPRPPRAGPRCPRRAVARGCQRLVGSGSSPCSPGP